MRYLLIRDDDGHWYLIAESDHDAFNAYVFESGPEPASMQRLAGSPSNVTFENPYEFGTPMT
jgi:hypothetical protein